ncbi:MAG: SusD/RagB family nutrient-binding outer membrane lipoprotein [Aequorivita sp.]|jgi:hypothetical protein|nr:SusD/RagB family nutrient-binding outer membrane lipoprotein [Aequorivita sp.]
MKKLIIIFTAAVMAVSCSDNLEDLNQNIKDPASVSGESLYLSAEKQLADQIVTPNVNLNNNRLWVQYLQETTYTDESNYDQITRPIPGNHWREMYRDVLKDLDEAAKIIEATDNPLTNDLKQNKLAAIEILSVYAWSNLVETFGDIPYSEALDIDNVLPKYDDGLTVYKDLINRLTAASNNIDVSKGIIGNKLGLDASGWKKFANSLKLRMGIMLSDVDAATSQSAVQTAVTAGVFTSNADNASYQYSANAPNNNPMNDNLVLSGRNDYVAASTLVNIMNDVNDPRRSAYFNGKVEFTFDDPVFGVSTTGTVTTISFENDLLYVPAVGDEVYLVVEEGDDVLLGTILNVNDASIEIDNINTSVAVDDEIAIVSYVGGLPGDAATYANYTHVNDRVVDPTEPGVLLSYVEVEFLLAEAAARGYNVGGTAESHYNAGITASFNYWNVSGASSYLADPEVNYTTALAASTSDPKWKMVIGTQAYIALYNRTFAPYLSVRRLDYPILREPVDAQSGFPVRYTYPVTEQTLNGTNYSAASSAIGGDAAETQLFWDKFYTFDF